jgi:transposase
MKTKTAICWDAIAEALAIGVDVCKTHLDVVWLSGVHGWRRRIPNTASAISEFVDALIQGGFKGTVLCEATSHYHVLLAVMLCEAGLDIRVINPLMSSKHAKSSIRKTKTDAVDAQVLAVMVLTEPNLPPPLKLTRTQCAIRHTLGLIHNLEKHVQGMDRSLTSYHERLSQLGLDMGASSKKTAEAVRHLKKCHEELLLEIESLLREAQADKQEQVQRVSEISGITKRNAALFTYVLDPEVNSAKSWMAYVGLDVAIRESGAWRGRGRITKRGPALLRKRLIQAAWGATMNSPQARRYYDHLKAKGRKHKEALVIMARKLLSIIFSLVVSGKSFDPDRAFAIVT